MDRHNGTISSTRSFKGTTLLNKNPRAASTVAAAISPGGAAGSSREVGVPRHSCPDVLESRGRARYTTHRVCLTSGRIDTGNEVYRGRHRASPAWDSAVRSGGRAIYDCGTPCSCLRFRIASALFDQHPG